jgi:hypothetical protein
VQLTKDLHQAKLELVLRAPVNCWTCLEITYHTEPLEGETTETGRDVALRQCGNSEGAVFRCAEGGVGAGGRNCEGRRCQSSAKRSSDGHREVLEVFLRNGHSLPAQRLGRIVEDVDVVHQRMDCDNLNV